MPLNWLPTYSYVLSLWFNNRRYLPLHWLTMFPWYRKYTWKATSATNWHLDIKKTEFYGSVSLDFSLISTNVICLIIVFLSKGVESVCFSNNQSIFRLASCMYLYLLVPFLIINLPLQCLLRSWCSHFVLIMFLFIKVHNFVSFPEISEWCNPNQMIKLTCLMCTGINTKEAQPMYQSYLNSKKYSPKSLENLAGKASLGVLREYTGRTWKLHSQIIG